MAETAYETELLNGNISKIFAGVYNDFKAKAVSEYKFELEPLPYEEFIEEYSTDKRGGVQKLVETARKRLEKYNISLKGTEDIQDALLHMQRTQKTKDDLHEYNDEICRRLIHLIESD